MRQIWFGNVSLACEVLLYTDSHCSSRQLSSQLRNINNQEKVSVKYWIFSYRLNLTEYKNNSYNKSTIYSSLSWKAKISPFSCVWWIIIYLISHYWSPNKASGFLRFRTMLVNGYFILNQQQQVQGPVKGAKPFFRSLLFWLAVEVLSPCQK